MAYHGGSLEEQTDVIASLAAERSGASYYGVLQPEDLQWHIPSHRVTPKSSPQLATFIDHVDIVITIHGFGRRDNFTSLLLGGQNREFADHVAGHLRPRLPEYDVVTELARIPKDLRGLHPDNPVNLPDEQGRADRATAAHPRLEPDLGRLGPHNDGPAHGRPDRRSRRRRHALGYGANRSMTHASPEPRR